MFRNSAHKHRRRESEFRSQEKRKIKSGLPLSPSGSWLLAPDFCFSSFQFVEQATRSFITRLNREGALKFRLRAPQKSLLGVKLCEHHTERSIVRIKRDGGFEFSFRVAPHPLVASERTPIVCTITRL